MPSNSTSILQEASLSANPLGATLNLTKAQKAKLIVGLTGGIGSGKTVASDWFASQGIAVVDADVIAHQIVAKGQPVLHQIHQHFGDWVLTPEGVLDRAALREYVFSHPMALQELEAITHPAIRAEIKQQLLTAQSAYVILSAPLLLEASVKDKSEGLASFCDRILVIDVPEHLQLQRATKRDDQSQQKIRAIMDKQLTRESRLEQADDIIVNDSSLESLYEKLAPLHAHYLKLAKLKP